MFFSGVEDVRQGRFIDGTSVIEAGIQVAPQLIELTMALHVVRHGKTDQDHLARKRTKGTELNGQSGARAVEGIVEAWHACLQALATGDIEALEYLLDEGFTLTHVNGYVQPKNEWLTQMRAGQFVYHSVEEKNLDAEVTGSTAHLAGRTVVDTTVSGTRDTWQVQFDFDYVLTWLSAFRVVATGEPFPEARTEAAHHDELLEKALGRRWPWHRCRVPEAQHQLQAERRPVRADPAHHRLRRLHGRQRLRGPQELNPAHPTRLRLLPLPGVHRAHRVAPPAEPLAVGDCTAPGTDQVRRRAPGPGACRALHRAGTRW
ncbi:nuclear transport factor 2 family protein [Streptomyces sp. NPDC001833]|uniref:nuclear transport factor 2 family protein n=1 Tax=Streptomyces sp. NPDC001833 TaxID=3154658 RepID=UPI003334234F